MFMYIQGEDGAILEDEPVLNKGIGQALNVAVNKGFLQKEKLKSQKMSKNMLEMTAQNYSIEDKRYEYVSILTIIFLKCLTKFPLF